MNVWRSQQLVQEQLWSVVVAQQNMSDEWTFQLSADTNELDGFVSARLRE